MRRPLICLIGLCMLSMRAAAVNISDDSSGQVLVLPFYLVGGGFQTIFGIRNVDTQRGRALRFVTKDPINGRPTLSLNIYLKPGDSWSSALVDPSGEASIDDADASLARWVDESCTFPALSEIPETGLALSDRFLGEDLGDTIVSNRISAGFIEVYEMGVIDAELAADCDGIAARWASGEWMDQDVTAERGAGVSMPDGSLEGYAAVINVDAGRSFHFEALVLDDFRRSALHTHPDHSRVPSLADVDPPESRVLESVQFGNRVIRVERISSWTANPVNAVDALLMTESARSDYSSSVDINAVASVIMTLPTRAYHTDAEDFYQAESGRQLPPFKVSVPLAAGESLQQNALRVKAVNRKGVETELKAASGARDCNLINGSLVNVFMTNVVGFGHTCEFIRAEFQVLGPATEGEVSFFFDGQIVSDEGHVFHGLPVHGVLLQSLGNRFINLPGGDRGIANYGWARILKTQHRVSDPEEG
jgi:hypothetical protein